MTTYYNPPHEIRDPEKLQSMIDTLRNGGTLPPVVVCGDQALTGSHRIAAWEACQMQADVVELSNEEYIAAVTAMGLNWEEDTVNDYNEFCEALYAITSDPDVKAAVADQFE